MTAIDFSRSSFTLFQLNRSNVPFGATLVSFPPDLDPPSVRKQRHRYFADALPLLTGRDFSHPAEA
jgi:hypothetical protein